jgi:hypothetical protein
VKRVQLISKNSFGGRCGGSAKENLRTRGEDFLRRFFFVLFQVIFVRRQQKSAKVRSFATDRNEPQKEKVSQLIVEVNRSGGLIEAIDLW